jgi:hypothetical protein
MCLECGCGKPNESYGDERHFTMDELMEAAQVDGITPREAAQNIMNTVMMMEGDQPQQGQQMQM